jgi:CP family cyanate transporter-like MFS transporter
MRPGEADDAAGIPFGRVATCVVLLWLAGNGLRLTILAVPPLIPLIHDDLRMSETEVGILSGLPVVLFAFAAVPGSLLIARFGALATVITGLVVTALGSALRGAAPNVALLYAATIVTGFGVAVMQPSMPPLVRAWLPHRIGFGTAVYTNGLLIGEILPVSLMLPVVLPLVGGSWRLGFVVWAVPCVVVAAIILALAPRDAVAPAGTQAPRRWWPDWRSGLLWRLGLMMGGINATYFSTNAFLPDYLTYTGHPDLIGPALISLNVGQLPASFLLLALAGRVVRNSASYVVVGALAFLGVLGIMLGNGTVIVGCAGLIGFAAAGGLILILTLPPLLSAPEDVPRMAAGIFTISYSCAVIVPIISGVTWDLTAIPAVAFIPICLSALMMVALAPTLGIGRRSPAPA